MHERSYARHRAAPVHSHRSGPLEIAFGGMLVVALAVFFTFMIGVSLGMQPWPL
ncbi:hypothetical protein [Catenulispora yoronensis]